MIVKRSETVQAKLWTLAEYEHMVAVGAFPPGVRLELLAGEIVQKMTPQGEPHAVLVGLAADEAQRAFDGLGHVRVRMPLAIAPDSRPEPDVAIVRGVRRDYLSGHPTTALIVIEVADTTKPYDRYKSGVYARASIPEFWIVSVADNWVEVHTEPTRDAGSELGFSYAEMRTYKRGESIRLVAAPGKKIDVADLLP